MGRSNRDELDAADECRCGADGVVDGGDDGVERMTGKAQLFGEAPGCYYSRQKLGRVSVGLRSVQGHEDDAAVPCSLDGNGNILSAKQVERLGGQAGQIHAH